MDKLSKEEAEAIRKADDDDGDAEFIPDSL